MALQNPDIGDYFMTPDTAWILGGNPYPFMGGSSPDPFGTGGGNSPDNPSWYPWYDPEFWLSQLPFPDSQQGGTVSGPPPEAPEATPLPVDPNLQPPAVEDVLPIPPQLADPEQGEVPQYQDAVQMPQPADPGAG